MEKIYKTKDSLIIEVPLRQKTFNPYYEEEVGEMDNIIGIIEPKSNCGYPECGFAKQIDMSYKNKPPQYTSSFYIFGGSKEEFIKLCKKLGIDIFEYEKCDSCGRAIYGCITWNDKGKFCGNCELKT